MNCHEKEVRFECGMYGCVGRLRCPAFEIGDRARNRSLGLLSLLSAFAVNHVRERAFEAQSDDIDDVDVERNEQACRPFIPMKDRPVSDAGDNGKIETKQKDDRHQQNLKCL